MLLIYILLLRGNDVGYFATFQIGTPPRDFRLLVDSGSADTWVGAETCKSDKGGGCVGIQLPNIVAFDLEFYSRAITISLGTRVPPPSEILVVLSQLLTALVRSPGI